MNAFQCYCEKVRDSIYFDFAPTTTKPNPAIKEAVLRIGDNGSVS